MMPSVRSQTEKKASYESGNENILSDYEVSSPVRIALVCVSLRAGGTERIVSKLANYFAGRYATCLVCLAPGEPFYTLDRRVRLASPALVQQSAKKFLRRWAQLRHLVQTLRDFRPSITLIFGEDIAGVCCLVARLSGTGNLAVLFRGTPNRSLRGINGLLNPLACRFAQHVVVQTETARQQLSSRYSLERLIAIPNPVEVPTDVPPLQARERIILSVGSLGRKKNQAALIRAFASLAHREEWRLAFVGDGAARRKLEKLAQVLGVSEAVDFRGECEDVNEHLQGARIFAFSSLSEGFPNALAEALAAGCACISYDCPTGPADLIRNDVDGLLVPNNDEVAFRDSLEKLIGDPALQVRLAGAARQNIRRFDAGVVIERFEELVRGSIYDRAVSGLR